MTMATASWSSSTLVQSQISGFGGGLRQSRSDPKSLSFTREIGTATIEGLSLNLEDMLAKSVSGAQSQNDDFLAKHTMFNEGNSLKRRRQGLFSFLRVIPAFTESFSESDEDDLKTDTLRTKLESTAIIASELFSEVTCTKRKLQNKSCELKM
ncbi:unnamed protein product [Camellia sinensis]